MSYTLEPVKEEVCTCIETFPKNMQNIIYKENRACGCQCPESQKKLREFAAGLDGIEANSSSCATCACDRWMQRAARELKAALTAQLQLVTETITGFKKLAAFLKTTDPSLVQGVYRATGYPRGACPGVKS